jgi:hypothetical protein
MSLDVLSVNALLEMNATLRDYLNSSAFNVKSAIAEDPTNTSLWPLIPLISGTSINVCDTSGNFRCGACCLWTVPAGATKVQFQIWGAGTGTTVGSCCAGAPFGDTGAYASVIINAVPGCQYTLCAGCAMCCYANSCLSQCNIANGCKSFVTGFGLTNLCAEGGAPSYVFCTMQDLHGTTCCRYQALGQTTAGSCICGSGAYYCFASSCATCGEIPVKASARTFYGTATTGTVFGLPSLHGGGCYDTNFYGYHTAAPVIGTNHTPFSGSSCRATFDSGSCCGGCRCRANDGAFQYPGAGGFYTHMMGGSTAWAGDAGRMGMVRVTYC